MTTDFHQTGSGDAAFGDFHDDGFGAFKKNPTPSTEHGLAMSIFSSSQSSEALNSRSSRKSSKSSGNKKKDKVSSSRRNSMDSEKERELVHRMTNSSSSSPQQFADFHKSFDSASHKTPATHGMTTTASRRSNNSGGSKSNGSSRHRDVTLQFPDDDFFRPQQQQPANPNNCSDEDDDDDDSIVSEISGLTEVFSTVHMGEGPTAEECQQEALAYQRESGAPTTSGYNNNNNNSKPLTKSTVSVRTRSSTSTKKSISFSTVSIRLYERILVENPATIKGVSIGIGWRYASKPAQDITKYEYASGNTTKQSAQLVIGPDAREALLLDLGYTKKELATALRSINKARNQRRQTVQNLKAEKVEEAFENAGKKVKSILSFKKNKSK